MSQPSFSGGGDRAFEPWAGLAAILAGIGGVIYSVAFLGGVVLGANPVLGMLVASAALMVGGVLSLLVLVAIYRRLLPASPGVALLGLALALMGALGSVLHGGFDLANVIHPPAVDVLTEAGLPSPVDPRGLLTFGMSGLGLIVLSAQARRTGALSRRVTNLGVVLGGLLVIVYLGRLIVLDPTNLLVAVPAGLTGVIVAPLFYISLGMELRRR
ncbi:MAG: hypothetical protein ACRDFZ_02130 [Candidatus Limnocylindria bacterium]